MWTFCAKLTCLSTAPRQMWASSNNIFSYAVYIPASIWISRAASIARESDPTHICECVLLLCEHCTTAAHRCVCQWLLCKVPRPFVSPKWHFLWHSFFSRSPHFSPCTTLWPKWPIFFLHSNWNIPVISFAPTVSGMTPLNFNIGDRRSLRSRTRACKKTIILSKMAK